MGNREKLTVRSGFGRVLAGLVVCCGLMFIVRSATTAPRPYALADDCPRGALVYVQFEDLPKFLRLWNESTLKKNWLESRNFDRFKNRHLGLKLVERFDEFTSQLGFEPDDEAFSTAADTQAALAVYDIGRMEMVFVAPLDAEKAVLTKFFAVKDGFEEIELPDGTMYYKKDVETDRGRLKQKFAFGALKGRFVIATNEQLFLRAVANINKKPQRDRLSDDAAFRALSAKVSPHFVTAWLDQAKLNSDWYFRGYWLMSRVESLKDLRAGMLDWEMTDDKWIERRTFSTVGAQTPAGFVTASEVGRIESLIPSDAPFFKVTPFGGAEETTRLIGDSLSEPLPSIETRSAKTWDYGSGDYLYEGGEYDGFWYGGAYLSGDFDREITEKEVDSDDRTAYFGGGSERGRREFDRLFGQVVQSAQPAAVTLVERPVPQPDPLFADYQTACVLTLRNPAQFDPATLERALSALVLGRSTVGVRPEQLTWTTKTEDGAMRHETNPPTPGKNLCFALKGSELVLANSPELLHAVVSGGNEVGKRKEGKPSPFGSVDRLTVIRFEHRAAAFHQIFDKIEREEAKGSTSFRGEKFFSEEIGGLLKVGSNVREVRVSEKSASGLLREEIEIILGK